MDFEVQYSKRVTVSIVIKNGRVIVKAPKRYPKRKIAELVEKHDEWIRTHLAKEAEKRKIEDMITPESEALLRRRARVYLKDKIDHYSRIMALYPGRITITGAKTRFGSCSSKGNISFSFRLMMYPEAAREYVVVHELCHLVHMNHSKAFYSLIEKYMPDYRSRKALLTAENCRLPEK